MANIKTKIILPYGPLTAWTDGEKSTRVMGAGELGIVNDANGKFKVFEGTGASFSEGVRWLDIEALQVRLSNDQDLQTAFDALAEQVDGISSYAEIKAALVEDGFALSGDVDAAIQEALTGYATTDSLTAYALSADVYGKSETSSAAEIQAALEGKQDAGDYLSANALDNYYDKTQVSSAAEVEAALALKADASDLSDYYTKDEVDAAISDFVKEDALTAYYQKSETSSSAEIDGALALKADKADLDDYALTSSLTAYALSADVDSLLGGKADADAVYAKSETSSAAEISDALTALNDTLTAFVDKTELSIGYDSDEKKIKLLGGTTTTEIDATDFIKDGMLSSAEYDAENKQIVLAFNTDAGATPISVDVAALVDTYTAEDTRTIDLSVENNAFSASIKDGSITPGLLSADAEWVFDCNL